MRFISIPDLHSPQIATLIRSALPCCTSITWIPLVSHTARLKHTVEVGGWLALWCLYRRPIGLQKCELPNRGVIPMDKCDGIHWCIEYILITVAHSELVTVSAQKQHTNHMLVAHHVQHSCCLGFIHFTVYQWWMVRNVQLCLQLYTKHISCVLKIKPINGHGTCIFVCSTDL